MTPEVQAMLCAEFREDLPRILDGTDPYTADLRQPERVTAREIIAAVSAVSGVPVEAMFGQRRGIEVARARQLICYLLRELRPDMSAAQIGHQVNVDHSTVFHAIRVITRLLYEDEEIRSRHDLAMARLGR